MCCQTQHVYLETNGHFNRYKVKACTFNITDQNKHRLNTCNLIVPNIFFKRSKSKEEVMCFISKVHGLWKPIVDLLSLLNIEFIELCNDFQPTYFVMVTQRWKHNLIFELISRRTFSIHLYMDKMNFHMKPD